MNALCSTATLSLALFLTACSTTQQVKNTPTAEPDTVQQAAPPAAEAPTAQDEPAPVPTEEQQKAAEHMLDTAQAPSMVADQSAPSSPQEAPATPLSADGLPLPAGGLRMGSIIPQEEQASAGDAPPPSANSVELRGLRSPKMPSSLPMGIDGKLNNSQ